MSALKDRLRSDLTAAMKARDELRTATLRMALTAIHNAEVSGTQARELTDEQVTQVLAREAKKRRESVAAFTAAGRTGLAEREQAEGVVLDGYLPKQADDDELADAVRRAIEQSGASGPAAMGQVMKAVGGQLAGRAEGGRIAAEVKRQLTGSS
jgi:uncharacterized protein YqeY